MATSKRRAAEAIDYSMEEKIIALYDLQQVDSKIDEINKLKGELPLEVEDLEDVVEGLQSRIDNINAEVEELTQLTKQRKGEIDDSKALIVKYEEQQKNVRNNREFDSLNKEMEYQLLEIELSEKRLKEFTAGAKEKKKKIEESEVILAGRKIDLENKRKELDTIDKETAKEIAVLDVQKEKAQQKIDERLLVAYKRTRKNVHNGLAVVTVDRDACGGCFNRIPPQRQFEVRQNRKIIVCEYCGRILVSDLLKEEPTEKATKA